MKKLLLSLILLSTQVFADVDQNPYTFHYNLKKAIYSMDFSFENEKSNEQRIITNGIVFYLELKKMLNDLKTMNDKVVESTLLDIQNGEAINGEKLTFLHKGVGSYLMLVQKMLQLSSIYTPKNLKELDETFISHNRLENKSNMLWLQMHLTLLENYIDSYDKYLENNKLRRLLDDKDKSYNVGRGDIKRLVRTLLNKKYLKKLKEALQNYEENNDLVVSQTSRDFELLLMKRSIDNSIAKEMILNRAPVTFKDLRKKLKSKRFGDFFADLWKFSVHHISGVIGNAAGSVRWRKGWLINNKQINQRIMDQLRPLDVITEKIYFALTDKMIPGHFGHNAIWLGTEEQLKEIGMWNHPEIIPFHEDIKNGMSIIETDRSGTHLKSLPVFMNVDEFAILRHKDENILENKKYLNNFLTILLRQHGKTYDFNFDVETTDRLVCSELLYQAFGEVKWPTEAYFGRITISPDNVTELVFYENSPFELIDYFKGSTQGEIINKDIHDLASDIGYEYSQEEDMFVKPTTICKKLIVDGKKKKTCITKREVRRYQAPRAI